MSLVLRPGPGNLPTGACVRATPIALSIRRLQSRWSSEHVSPRSRPPRAPLEPRGPVAHAPLVALVVWYGRNFPGLFVGVRPLRLCGSNWCSIFKRSRRETRESVICVQLLLWVRSAAGTIVCFVIIVPGADAATLTDTAYIGTVRKPAIHNSSCISRSYLCGRLRLFKYVWSHCTRPDERIKHARGFLVPQSCAFLKPLMKKRSQYGFSADKPLNYHLGTDRSGIISRC